MAEWDSSKLKEEIASIARLIRFNIERARREDLRRNPEYWRYCDQELGELQVYLGLDDARSLESREAFLSRLIEMRQALPELPGAVKDAARFVDGYQTAIRCLIAKYDPGSAAEQGAAAAPARPASPNGAPGGATTTDSSPTAGGAKAHDRLPARRRSP